jgi:hypothetical protein
MEIKALEGQSLLDIAIQESGSIDSVFACSVANNVSISNEISVNVPIFVNALIVNKEIVDYYKSKRITPATYSSMKIEDELNGIGYMIVGKNFIVS